MHYRFLRDSFVGRMIYHLSGHKYFAHKEEYADYVVPEKYLPETKKPTSSSEEHDKETNLEDPSRTSNSTAVDYDDKILVTWDGDDDEENPLNWPFYQKAFFIFQISFLTTSVYMGSAVYTPGIEELERDMNIGRVVATLPLTLFVIGYGLGPMLFSPLSENAIFGRASIYIVTLTIFVILQVPTALVRNIAGLCILCFLGGFFASPCLATGGASVADIIPIWNAPLGLSIWSLGAAGWRWTFWFMCILSGFALAILSVSFPESFSKTLLRRKAQRLRALTGNDRITSEGEIENANLTPHELLMEAVGRPLDITFMEPVVLLIDIYIAMVYSILYIFFEVFPIYFVGVRGFTLVELGTCYFSVFVGALVACAAYLPIIKRMFTDKILRGEKVYPEVFIPLAIVGGCLLTSGLFIFGWSGTRFTHWIGPLFGAAVTASGAFIIFQTLFNYMGASFKPIYIASVFASNDLFRSLVASVFPLFGAPLFNNLATPNFPVGWGSSVLGFITLVKIAIPVLFYLNGPKLRARSKYANWA
ncbi:Multidrug resistance protein 1 [Candida viswanathii]|uniref:Multidrug resistance protein 1 n=1 Tax=Candida viswanathii TaxID=5486 RepID=A0A367YG19_9ASCO|nr:Multidrug resistance protein 1 [Candida viswanathii]